MGLLQKKYLFTYAKLTDSFDNTDKFAKNSVRNNSGKNTKKLQSE